MATFAFSSTEMRVEDPDTALLEMAAADSQPPLTTPAASSSVMVGQPIDTIVGSGRQVPRGGQAAAAASAGASRPQRLRREPIVFDLSSSPAGAGAGGPSYQLPTTSSLARGARGAPSARRSGLFRGARRGVGRRGAP